MSVINTNITSMIGQQNLSKSQSALTTSMERLSSGLRINSAKDDAAGQAIANRMSAQITGLATAQRNANDGISVAQTAEGALNQVNDNLQRIRELSVQAQNDTNSEDDLTSIQNEIGQRLNEINRISEETEFNGVKVLAEDNSLKIQVGANDGQAINIDLKNINAQTLGLDGFNVDGSGETQNRTATVTDLLAQDGIDASDAANNNYKVTTTFDAAKAEDILGQLKDGDSVAVTTDSATTAVTTTYTYDADSENFSYDSTLSNATDRTALADSIAPKTGTTSGTYENGAGAVANFDVDSTGSITIGGEAAYITADGELTTNNGGSVTAATLDGLLSGGQGTMNIGGTEYTMGAGADTDAVATADNTVTFQKTASSSDVLSAINASYTGDAGDGAVFSMTSGLTSGTVTFDEDGATTDAYVDNSGELTDIATYDTDYTVNPETGEVTVTGNSANAGDYALEVGATVKVDSEGNLTTADTSKGDKTEDPLAALDSALSTVDALRSDLGAIQNRFDSAITNLSTTETNLSAARSRIEDADYATEVANMTRAQILQQAGTSVLAQANQIPQSVLSLLG